MKLLMTLLCLLILGSGILFGAIRRANRSLVRLGTLLLAVGGAFLLACFGVARAADLAVEYLKTNVITDAGVLAYMDDNPELAESLVAMVRTLIAPLLFLVFYMILKPFTWILYKLLCWALHIQGPVWRGFGRLAGAGVGLVCGVIGMVVLVVPICGYSNLAVDTVERLNLSKDSEMVAYVQMMAEVKDAPVAELAYGAVGKPMFQSLSTAELGEGKAVLETEVNAIGDLLTQARVVTKTPIQDFDEEQVQAVDRMAQDIDDSEVLSHVGSAILASASRSWLSDGAFLGASKPDMGENANIIINGMLRVLSTSNADNIGEDLGCVANIFGLMVKHEVFPLLASGLNPDELTAKLASQGVLDDFYAVLDQNPRMEPLKKAFADVGVNVLMQELGLPEDLRESHGEMLTDISTALKGSVDESNNINSEALEGEVKNVMQSHNIAVDDSAVKLVSEGIAQEFTGEELKTLTEDQIIDRLVERFASAGANAAK